MSIQSAHTLIKSAKKVISNLRDQLNGIDVQTPEDVEEQLQTIRSLEAHTAEMIRYTGCSSFDEFFEQCK